MNNLMIFEGHEVEVFELNGEVLFNPYHVGECLELSGEGVRKAISRMNEKQVVKVKNSDIGSTNFRKLNNAGENFLTESGVYKLVFKSRKPNAEAFTDWVTDDVLPYIRKHEIYATDNVIDNILNNPDFGIELLTKLKEERAERTLGNSKNAFKIYETEDDYDFLGKGNNKYLGFVYILECGDELKIGCTKNPAKRITALKSMLERYAKRDIGRLALSRSHTNYQQNEKLLHMKFAQNRILGTELFTLNFEKAVEIAEQYITFEDISDKKEKQSKDFLKFMRNVIVENRKDIKTTPLNRTLNKTSTNIIPENFSVGQKKMFEALLSIESEKDEQLKQLIKDNTLLRDIEDMINYNNVIMPE